MTMVIPILQPKQLRLGKRSNWPKFTQLVNDRPMQIHVCHMFQRKPLSSAFSLLQDSACQLTRDLHSFLHSSTLCQGYREVIRVHGPQFSSTMSQQEAADQVHGTTSFVPAIHSQGP